MYYDVNATTNFGEFIFDPISFEMFLVTILYQFRKIRIFFCFFTKNAKWLASNRS